MIITDGVHLVSTENEEELHSFASKIGLKKSWYQCHSYYSKRTRPHYDLTTPRAVKRAVANGAKLVSGKFLISNTWWVKK